MSKPRAADLIAVQVMREQEWAYDQRRRHLSMREVSRLTIEAPPVGLGYYLSPHQIKGLLNGYIERMRDAFEESPAETVAQELADLDMQYRRAAQLSTVYTGEQAIDDETGQPYEVRRDERIVIAALARMESIGARRAKLLGTDAVTKSAVEVTVHDATDSAIRELARELDRQA